MLSGLLATALLAPAQPPAQPALPIQARPVPQGEGRGQPPANPGGAVPVMPPTHVPMPFAGPAASAPMAGDGPPSIDPTPIGVCQPESGFSFNTTHQGPPWTWWGGADYRMYWFRAAPTPGVLATVNGVPFGNAETEYGRVNGIGFTTGSWLNGRNTFGIEFGGFLFDQVTRTASVTGPGIVNRPFIDALLAGPAVYAVNDPAAGITGGLSTAVGARLSGFEVNGVNNLANECNWSADYIAGFRYLDLDEYTAITQTGTANVPNGGLPYPGVGRIPGQVGLSLSDRFRTRNQFYGGQVGVRGEVRSGGWFAGLSTKVGIGNVHQRVDIDGRTDVTGQPSVPGGLLATQGANLGRYTTNRFGVLVDLGLSTGYQFASWGRVKVGYDFLYLNDVSRANHQIDQTLSSRFVPTSINFAGASGLRSPQPTQRTDDFFAHGLRFGLELMY